MYVFGTLFHIWRDHFPGLKDLQLRAEWKVFLPLYWHKAQYVISECFDLNRETDNNELQNTDLWYRKLKQRRWLRRVTAPWNFYMATFDPGWEGNQQQKQHKLYLHDYDYVVTVLQSFT